MTQICSPFSVFLIYVSGLNLCIKGTIVRFSDGCVFLKEIYFSNTILKDFRNAPPAKMLIYCQKVIF